MTTKTTSKQKRAVPSPASHGSPLSDFQQRMIGHMARGCGIDARPSQLKVRERREMDDLVTRGLARKARNHSQDKHGMYVANDKHEVSPL